MYVIKKLRLNRFKMEPVVSARALFARMKGKITNETSGSKSTSDCISDAIYQHTTKLQSLALVDEIVKKRSEFQHDPEGTDPLNQDPREL